MPRYPIYPSQPNSGNLPNMFDMGPPDMRASSTTGTVYQRRFDKMYGRNIAGLGAIAKPVGGDTEPAWALNELKYVNEMDDVQGSGIFDPPESRPNNYPDAGVLSSSYSFPGYLARDRMYQKSEVVDSTTGRPVVYVNGGAVSMDSAAQVAFIENNLYDPPRPIMDRYGEMPVRGESTVNVMQNPIPIGQDAAPAPAASSSKGLLITLGVLGLAAGAVWALSRGKGK